MHLSKIQKTLGLLATMGITVSSLISPVIAGGFDDAFASRIWLKRDLIGNYQLKFVPSKNSYSYQVQIAGKGRENTLACASFAATEQERLEWRKVIAEIGTDKSNLHAEADVVAVFGAYIGRIPFGNKISNSMHVRVVAIDESGNEIHKTNWEGGNDIKNWGWSGNCAWVAQ